MRIILTGGGTGGHLFPLLAVKKEIEKKETEVEFLFIGPKGRLEEKIMQSEGIKTKYILAGKLRRYFSFQNFLDFFKIQIGFLQSLWMLLVFMPDAIFSKGGFASFPVVVAAWIYRIPVLIHESDSVPGLSNSILSKFAKRVAVSYPESLKEFPSSQAILTGNPLRSEINKGNADKARDIFGLISEKKVVFIYGGSQGSKIINDKIINILPELLKKYQVIHQTGTKNLEESKTRAGRMGIKSNYAGYHPIGFIGEELKDILAVSDLIISRAGANSISEIAANQKPCILIPLTKAANNHQRMNAFSLARKEACFVLEENNLGENLLLTRIEEIMNSEEVKNKFSQNIQEFYHKDAAERIAEGVLEIAK